MTLLAHSELVQLRNIGVITDVPYENINAASIDITLGGIIMVEDVDADEDTPVVNLKQRHPLKMRKVDISQGGAYYLTPGQFILAQSVERFNLPNNISAEYKLKSSMARVGLEHLNAGWCDAGWNGSVLTLELKNMTQHHIIAIQAGVGIGQMVFFKHAEVPEDRSYAARGRYNNDKTVSGVKL